MRWQWLIGGMAVFHTLEPGFIVSKYTRDLIQIHGRHFVSVFDTFKFRNIETLERVSNEMILLCKYCQPSAPGLVKINGNVNVITARTSEIPSLFELDTKVTKTYSSFLSSSPYTVIVWHNVEELTVDGLQVWNCFRDITEIVWVRWQFYRFIVFNHFVSNLLLNL